jgi:hypothetical protein
MNPQALRSHDTIVQGMEDRARRSRRRVSTAPLVLTLGLVLADMLLAYLVPMIWESLLPQGLEQADRLGGWPGLVWRAAVFCQTHQRAIPFGIVAAGAVGLLACRLARPLRHLVWLSAVGVIALNAAILIVTIHTSLRATAAAAGFDLD